jgi:hypothetical protein
MIDDDLDALAALERLFDDRFVIVRVIVDEGGHEVRRIYRDVVVQSPPRRMGNGLDE